MYLFIKFVFPSGASSLIWKWGRSRLADWTAGQPIRSGLMMMGGATHMTVALQESWPKSAEGKSLPEPTCGPGLIQHSAARDSVACVCVCVTGILLLLQRGWTSSVLQIRTHKVTWVININFLELMPNYKFIRNYYQFKYWSLRNSNKALLCVCSAVGPSLWDSDLANQIVRAVNQRPRNGFEEMIQWMREGKLWSYPIDNQAGEWGLNKSLLWCHGEQQPIRCRVVFARRCCQYSSVGFRIQSSTPL